MGVLFRYEMKKLLSRKVVWLLFAVCLILLFVINQDELLDGWNGKAQGYRDVYKLYEGRVVTDAFKKEAKLDYIEYASARPEYFFAEEDPENGSIAYFPDNSPYYSYYNGVWRAYREILQSVSLESRQKGVENAKQYLETGVFENGRKLTDEEREYYAEVIRANAPMPIVHYAQGWRSLLETDTPASAIFLYFVLLVALLPLFRGESSARMESVLLCTAERWKAASAKMLVAFVAACAVAAVYFGMDFAITMGAYGFDGANLPLSVIDKNEYGYGMAAGLSAGGSYGLYALAVMLNAAALAALVALASAFFRHPLAALLAATVLIASQFLPSFAIFGGDPGWWMHMRVLPWFMSYGGGDDWWMNSPFWRAINDFTARLPAILLTNRYMTVSSASTLKFMPYAFGLPVLITALCLWLAPRQFLKRRKA